MTRDSNHRREYEARINRAIDYVVSHRAEALTLEQIAGVAAFSPYHFHRVFKACTGETLGQFIQRTRLEWAATDLVLRRDRSILATALDSGFNGAASFARAFRDRFGMSATEWRDGGAEAFSQEQNSKLGKVNGNPCKADGARACEFDPVRADAAWQELNMNVSVKTLPDYHLAYLRHVGPYGAGGGIPAIWQELVRWAKAHDLWNDDALLVGVARDNPMITDPARLRYDASIVVAQGFQPSGRVNVTDMPGGKCAVLAFRGTAFEIERGWHDFFSAWLPGSGYQPDDRPCFELYRAQDEVDPNTGIFKCELCAPVRAL